MGDSMRVRKPYVASEGVLTRCVVLPEGEGEREGGVGGGARVRARWWVKGVTCGKPGSRSTRSEQQAVSPAMTAATKSLIWRQSVVADWADWSGEQPSYGAGSCEDQHRSAANL